MQSPNEMEPDRNIPSVEAVLRDPATSSWLSEALITALLRDPVDAANDAEILAWVLAHRCQILLRQGS